MTTPADFEKRVLALARPLIANLNNAERQRLLLWAQELMRIRESNLPAWRKGQLALKASVRTDVALPLLRHLAREARSLGIRSKKHLWDNRGWAARLGMIGVSLGGIVVGGKGAGIAALGGAIGVPLWLVIGAGGAVLGSLIDELSKTSEPSTTYTVIEAHRADGESRLEPRQDQGNSVG
jgi:hypothetical protein